MSSTAARSYDFGPFKVDTVKRLLLREGEPVQLTPKAFDTLLALVENRERVVEKSELMDRIWPDSFVEETNLTQNISTIRKALGENPSHHQYIVTITGRGYRFVASVSEVCDARVKEVCDEGVELVVERHVRSRVTEELEDTSFEDKVEPGEAFNGHGETPGSLVQEQRMRGPGLALPVIVASAVGLILALAYLLHWGRPGRVGTVPGLKSIAVLPFKPISSEGRDEYLELGMADALITKLSNIHQIVVRPTSSVRRYAEQDQDPVAAGRELRVESVLEGSVQRQGDKVRVTVQLVSVSDGRPVWAYKCDDYCADVFTAQDAISEKVATALSLKLTGEDQKLLTRHYTENAEAYQLYLKGSYHLGKRTAAEATKAIEYYQQAIAMDPNYALAYTGLAESYAALHFLDQVPANDVMPKAKESVLRALTIDDALAEAHSILAEINETYDWDFPGAKREDLRAIELNPFSSTVRREHAFHLMDAGRFDEAISEMEWALQLDPVSVRINRDVAQVLYHARRYDEAIEQCQKTLDLDPNYGTAYVWLARAYEKKGLYDQAIACDTKSSRLSPEGVAELRETYSVSGWRGYLQKWLELVKGQPDPRYGVWSYELGRIYALLEERDNAFFWLDKAYKERSYQMVYLKIDPDLDSLRSDQRFQELLGQMRFPN